MSLQQREAIAALIAQKQAQESPKQTSAPGLRSFDASAKAPTGTPTVQTDFGDVIPAPGSYPQAGSGKKPDTEKQVFAGLSPYDKMLDSLEQSAIGETIQARETQASVETSGPKSDSWDRSLTQGFPEKLGETYDGGETGIFKPKSGPQDKTNKLPGERPMIQTDSGDILPAPEPINPTPEELHHAKLIAESEAQREKLLAEIDREYARLQKVYTDNLPRWNRERDAATPMFQNIHARAMNPIVYTPSGQKDLESALTELRIARDKLNAYTQKQLEADRKTGNQKSRGRQFLDGFLDQDIADVGTLGWDEVGRKFRQTRALEKSANGEKLTDEEQALLLSAAIGQKADQYLNEQGGKTTWGNIGTSVSKSIPFMVQTAASGGTGGVVKLGANVAKKGAKALAKRAALKAAEMAANSAIQTPLMSTAYADFANSTKGQYYVTREPAGELSVIKTDPTSPWERSWKAFASGFTETFSERLGTVFPTGAAIGNFVRRNAPKALGKTLGGWLTEGIGKFESPLVKQINRWASKVPGYNGTLGEFGEELAGNLIEPVLTGELERIPENFSKENLWQTVMSVAIMGGMMETVRIPAAIADGVRSEQLRRAAQEQLDRIADPTIKEKVRQAMEAEENEERVRQLTQIDWRGIDRRDAIAAVNYVELHTRGDLSAGAEQALEQGRKIRGWTHTFGQFVNRDTGRAQIVIDREGTTYFVRSGSLDGTEADATVFVLNAETGETKQCNAEELTLQEEYDLDGYIRMRSEREEARHRAETKTTNGAQAEAEAKAIQEIDAESAATGEDPAPRVAEYKGIDLNTLAGQTVTLADGSQAYINQVYTNRNGFVEIDAVPVDPSTGQLLTDERGEEAHTLLDVRSIVTPKQQQQAQTQGNTQEATPAVPEQSPTQETQAAKQPAPSETELSAAEQSAQTTQEQATQENSQSTLTGTPDNTTTQSQNRTGSANLEPEIDENGLPFVTTSDGDINFGQIARREGMPDAPIRVSEGFNTVDARGNNHGYGLKHIEASHGKQIRAAGYDSVTDFIEQVAQNYTTVKRGKPRGGRNTYLLEWNDGHNNTLFVELSNNGEYWNVNSAGIFRKDYSRNKEAVRPVPAVGNNISDDAADVRGTTMDGNPVSGNSLKTTSLQDKTTTFGPNAQEAEQNIPRKKDGTPDYDQIEDPATVDDATIVKLDPSQIMTIDGKPVQTGQQETPSQIGRSLTADEAEALIQTMQAQAIPAPELELTPENWTAEFGENGEVETPVGTVKMGENQLAKMFMKGRSAQLGMVKPTLTTPDAIVEVESEASNGQTERPSSLLFIKTFLDKSGKKHTYFTSVTVRRDGMEVTISNHIEGEKRIRKFLEKGKLLYRIYGSAQTEQNRASVSGTTPPVNPGDLNKSTTFGPNAQEATQNIPRKKDGTPDYDQIEDPATVASALNEEFGEEAAEVARESLDEAREALEQADNIRKAIDRRRAQIKAQNEVTKWEEVCDALAPTRETGTTEQAAETQDVPDVTLDPVMGDLITEEMHRRAPGTITVREQSDPKANNNFIQRYDIDGQPSGVYGIYDIEANINTEPVSFGLDEFSWRAENWDELEAMYDAYKADRPEVRSWIDDEGGAQFRDINDALEFKRFVDTQKNSKTADPVREAATPTEKLRAVGGIVAEMNRASGAAAYVFNDVTELPEGLRSQLEEGFERDGITWRRESYICAPQMQDAEQTRRTYIHEVSGHQNVEHAILKMADRTALWEAIVDDIGLDGLRAWGISELTEEITAYEAGEMEKRQLGREALAYATELNADLPYFMRKKPLSLTIDLNQRITPETLRAILETANRYDDQRPRIEITNPGREGLLQNIDGVTRPAGGRIRAGNNSRSENTDNHISGNESTDPRGGDAPGSSFSTSRENDSRTVSGQDNARADRAESGALPAGETVADDIRYRRGGKTDTASDRTLVGVHNISGEYLLKAIRQGGMANPSVAVIDIDRQAYNHFGEISLVMPAALIDKRTGRNAGTWPTDAWTPVYPEVEKRFGKEGKAKARKDIRSVPQPMQETTRSGIEARIEERPENDRLAYLFLLERGKAPELIYSEGRYPREVRRAVEKAMGDYARFDRLTEAQQKQIVDIYIQTLHAGDRNAYQAEIREKAEKLQQKFREQTNPRSLVARRAKEKANRLTALGYDYQQVSDWANDVAEDLMHEGAFDEQGTVRRAKEYIEQNGLQEDFERWLDGLDERYQVREVVFDGFTPTGNRRYVPNTLENVSRIMREKGRNGAAGFGISFQSFAAGLLGAQGELDQIRKQKQKLTPNEAEVDAFHDRWGKVFFELGEKLQPGAKGFEDYGLHRLAEAAREKDPKAFIKREYGIDFTDEDVRRLKEMVDAIRNDYPATYFETKFERPVTLEEVAAAVVPDNADPKIRRALQEAGVAVTTYRAQDKADRKRALDEATAAEEIRFRNREAEMVDRLSPEQINTRFNDELQQQIDGSLPAGHVYRLGRPNSALLSAGIPDLPIELSATRLAEKANPEYASNHPFALEEVADLPRALAEPIAVFESKTQPGSRVILTELQHDGANFVAVLRVRKNDDTRNLDVEVNDIRSLYPKDRVGGIINWINNGLLRWVDKEKAAKFISTQWPNYIGGGENPGGGTPENVVLTQGPNYLAGENDRAVSSVTNIIKNFTNPTLREGEKASAAQTLADELGVPVRMVRSADEISGEESRFREKRGATGWHDRATGEIAVVLPNCADAAEVQRTILHEAVGHYGIPQLLGRERADELYRRVFDAVRDTRRGRELLDEHGSETVAGDEYLAEMAEGNVSPGVFRRMLAAVRAFFRDALGIDLKLTDADMRYLLWRSKHNLQRARTVGEAMEVIEQDIRLRAQTAHDSARERKAERLDKLRRSESLVFSGDEYKGKYELNSKSAGQYIVDHLRGTYTNANTGETIYISRKAQKVAHHDAENKVHLQSVVYIPQMLEKAIFIDEMPNTKSSTGFDSYRYYVCGLKIRGVDYTAKLVVGQKNGETYYDHALTQIEKGDLINQRDLVKAQVYDEKVATEKADLVERRDEISSSFTNNEAALSAIKDKRLVSVLQAEPLAYQQKTAKNEPKTVMEHLDRLADETDETRFRKKREPGPDDPIRTTKENLATRMGRKLQDAHIPVRQLQDYVREHGGTTDIDTDVYSALNRAFGRQTERMRRTDEKFRRIEKRVNEIHRKWGFGYKATEEYLAAKSSQERHASGIAAYAETTEAPWNRLHVEETIARFESVVPKEKIEALWRDIREMTQHQLDVMKNCDLITIQTYRDIQARGWQYYLPLQGLDFEFEDMADPHKLFDDALTTGRGTGAGALLQKARGRTTKPGDVLATLQRNVHLTIMAGEQNLAKLFLLRLAEQNPQLQGDTRTGKTTADDVAAMTATNDRFNEELETLTPENADATILWLGSPSAVLLSAGIEKKPIKLHGNKVFKKMKKHGFALEELRNLPEAVADPIAIFKNYGKEGNRSILTELKTAQGNFLVTLTLGKGIDVDFNIVSSVFGKADDSVLNWFEQGYATYINKEKALDYLHHSALEAVTSDSQELSLSIKIQINYTQTKSKTLYLIAYFPNTLFHRHTLQGF